MALAPGTRLGSYEVVALLGAGGMGEVYRARDAKLNRDVAIKVLPAHLSDDPGARARFEREAKAIAALSHPNILAVHDFGFEAGAAFVVMELLEGETLRERLSRGALPVKRTLQIARDVAQGLAAAHDKGLVHRDIKPENVFLTSSGLVKILDFGLARQTNPGANIAAETTAMHLTDPGTILGTVAYMSPEQVRGEPADHRSDLFSLGCVLFEAMSGRRPFNRKTSADTMTAILRDDPPDLTRPDGSPMPSIDDLVRHSLEKQPEDRFQSARDLAFALQSLAGGSGTVSHPAVAAPAASVARRNPAAIAWIVAGLAMIGAGGAWWWALRAPAGEVWTGTRLGSPTQSYGARLSPDGQLLAFLAFVDQLPQVGVMKPDGSGWTVLTHDRTGYVTTVAWAPDGSRLYFDRAAGHPLGVYSMPPLGGDPRPLLDNAFGPEPLRDGSLIVLKATDRGDEQVFRFWPDTGRLEALPAFMERTDVAPILRAFPDGQEFVFFGTSEAERSKTSRLLVFNLASRQTRDLSRDVHLVGKWSPLAVAPDGESVFTLNDVADTRFLVQVPRRPGPLRVLLSFTTSASPVAVDAARDGSLYLDQLLTTISLIRASPSGGSPEEFALPVRSPFHAALADGQLLVPVFNGGRQQLAAARAGGEPRLLVNTTEDASLPATIFGDLLAFRIGAGNDRRIALASLRDGRVLRRYNARSDAGLSASPDGKTLYYSFDGGVWSQPVDGGEPTRITDGEDVVLDPQGQHLYVKRVRNGELSVVRLSVSGANAEELPVPSEYQVAVPDLAPAAVDAKGRILITVAARSFYYKTAVLDPATKSFTLLPITLDGDVAGAGWTADGRILAGGQRYLLSLWRYQRSSNPK